VRFSTLVPIHCGNPPPDGKAHVGSGQRLVQVGFGRERQVREARTRGRVQHRLGRPPASFDLAAGDNEIEFGIGESHGETS